jgi:Protein kinase domain
VSQPTYLPPGTVLQDRYEVLEEIGRGGYSVVYRAQDRRVGSDVAVKLLVPPPAAARLARERLRREVLAVRQLSHPNIVAVYDVADEGPWSYVVMEYVAGPDLAVRVRDAGPLTPGPAARLGRDVAAALEHAHRHGILHRDVKPQNILMSPDGRARLTDFGSARLSGQVTMTQTGGMVGTLAYAAPEVQAGARGDARADCYALGLTLHFALIGDLPDRAVRQGGPAPEAEGYRVRARRPEVPGWLDHAIAQATAADPTDRFPALSLLGEALEPDAEFTRGPVPVGKGTCVLCRASDPFGLGVCPRCARRASGRDDALVFVERPDRGRVRRDVRDAVAARTPGASTGGRLATVGGERPLLRVPAAAAPRVVELLAGHGIPARSEPVTSAWKTNISMPIAVLSWVVTGAGVAAGVFGATPVLLATSPLLGIGLAGAATMGRRIPVWNPPAGSRSGLPLDAEREAVRTLLGLPTGPARRLLLDVLRRAAVLPGYDDALGPLVIAACAAARELAGLEQHLDAFDARTERLAADPGGMDALARCERGRDALVQRLLDATASLSRLAGEAAVLAAGDHSPLATLARDLDAEGRLQAEAAREVDALLRDAC